MTVLKQQRYVLAFTGPRSLTKQETEKASLLLDEYLQAKKAEHRERLHALVGGARGVDNLARLKCLRFGIRLTLCIPHVNYRKYWAEEGLGEEYDMILQGSEKVVFVVSESKPWHPSHNFKRNEYMVKWCDTLVAVFPGRIPEDVFGKKVGGTRHCIEAALKAGKPIQHLDPRV